jgi:DNA-binding NtrC family response regulator
MNMIERGVILAQSGGRIEVHHLFPSYQEPAGELALHREPPAASDSARARCEAVLSGVATLDQIEAMLLETAVDRARGNLSSASRLLGITRAQLAYRLKRLHEPEKP